MKRFSKLDSKQRTIAVSGFSALALVSLVGGIYAINASADGDIIINFNSEFARRSMEDFAFTDMDNNYYAVDCKTHNIDTHFASRCQ